MPRRLLRLTCCCLLALAALGAPAQAGQAGDAPAATTTRILTSPPRILASVAPGASTTATLLVVNQSRSSVSLLVRASDLAPDPEGASFGVLADVGEGPRGAGAWLTIRNPTLALGPGEQREVPVTIRVPADADAGGHYGALVVETAPAQDASPSEDEAVRLRVRLVTHVNVLVPGDVRYAASITDMRARRLDDGMIEVRATFENEGNIQTTPRDAKAVVRGPRGARRSVELEIPETMPDGTRQLRERVRIPSAAGTFRSRIELVLEDGSVVRSRTVETVAWRPWVPIAIGGGLAILVLALLAIPFLRRRAEYRRLLREELERLEDGDHEGDEDELDATR